MTAIDIKVTPSATARGLLGGARFDTLVREAEREIVEEAEVVLAAHALYASGRMSRSVRSVRVGGETQIIAEAKNPQTGYDYVGVTRFGHKGIIVPRTRGRATVVATGKARKRGKKAMLRFSIGGRVVYSRSTKGFHPTTDWVKDALPEVDASAQRLLTRLARKVEVS